MNFTRIATGHVSTCQNTSALIECYNNFNSVTRNLLLLSQTCPWIRCSWMAYRSVSTTARWYRGHPEEGLQSCILTPNIWRSPWMFQLAYFEGQKSFFETIQNPKDKSHRILPPVKEKPRDTRSTNKFHLPKTYTNRFKISFVPYALFNLQ